MSEEKKVILCVLIAVGIVIIMLGIVFSKITDIEQRLDKCCPVKTEEVKADVQPNDTHTLQLDIERRAQLVQVAKRDKFLDGLDPQDAKLWSDLVPFAELDEQCNSLPECTQDQMHIARPITVRVQSTDGDLTYLAVLGLDIFTPQGHEMVPRITYIIGQQDGALMRMQSDRDLVEMRFPETGGWFEMNILLTDWFRDRVRTKFKHIVASRNKT